MACNSFLYFRSNRLCFLGCIHCIDKNRKDLRKERERQSTTSANTPQTASSIQHGRLIPLCDALLLFVHLSLRSPRAQVPAASTLIVLLMLNGDLAEMTDDVLHLRIAAATALAAEVVEPFDLVH